MALTVVLALAAGLSIPIGAAMSANRRLRALCIQNELDHFVAAVGGGALLAAIALVLLPFGIEHTSIISASTAFLSGGVVFWLVSRWLGARGGAPSQFLGMLLDFVPESVALGASAATGSTTAYLLAVLIALQNMPQGFVAHHEMLAAKVPRAKLWLLFLLAPLAGPLSAFIGNAFLSANHWPLAMLMLFCSGGILYLIFQDIAPQTKLKHHHFPAVGAVLGFLLGMVGTMVIHQ